jgi:cytochrome c oxidase subunit 4
MNSPAPIRVYAVTWLVLLGLLAATFGLAHVRLGAFNPVVSLAIAAVKALAVGLVFMHLRRSSTLVVLFAIVALVFMAILFGLSGADYLTRAIHAAPWLDPGTP